MCKRKSGKNRYIEFFDLLPHAEGILPSTNEFTLQFDGSANLSLVPANRSRKALTIEQWTTDFLRFVAVNSLKHPHETPALMKYGEIVRDLASRRQKACLVIL
jgi:hypothetical protein